MKNKEAIETKLQQSLQHYEALLQNVTAEFEQLRRTQEQLTTRKENQSFLCVLVLKFVALDGITNCDISLYRLCKSTNSCSWTITNEL